MNFLKNEIVEKYGLPEQVERGSYKCEDINKCINKSIAQNDYYCYV